MNLLDDVIASFLIFAQDVRPHDLRNLLLGILVDRIPDLEVGLLGLGRVLEGVGSLEGELLESGGLGLRQEAQFLNSVRFHWLV